jgi:hypothetical protein
MMEEMREMGIDPQGDLRELGYEYKEGKLQRTDASGGFRFEGQEKYNALADAVVSYVGLLLETEARLTPIWLPLGAVSGEDPRCCIFVSRDFEQAEKLLVIVQGQGRVRAGVWGCALCINDDFDKGTALPYLRKAVELKYGVVVLNPNANVDDDGQRIIGSESPEKHIAYVFENIIAANTAAAAIDVLAHSAGGQAMLQFLIRAATPNGVSPGATTAVAKVRRVVFTDSYHTKNQVDLMPPRTRALINDPARTVNYVPHTVPAGTPVDEWLSQDYRMTREEKGCVCLSAGTTDHASTNYMAQDMAFEFFTAAGPALDNMELAATVLTREVSTATSYPPTLSRKGSPTGEQSNATFQDPPAGSRKASPSGALTPDSQAAVAADLEDNPIRPRPQPDKGGGGGCCVLN